MQFLHAIINLIITQGVPSYTLTFTHTLITVPCAELKPLADKIAQERKMLNTKAEEIFPILRQQWQQHFVAFMDTR
jgi:hypothetical protein